MEEILANFCERLRDLFYRGFGDRNGSTSKDFIVPTGTAWVNALVMSTPSKLIIRNLSVADEVQFSFNPLDLVGSKLMVNSAIVLDDMVGVLYLKMVDSTKTANVNLSAIALYTGN